jgi:PAS domain S-box-containing protein
VSRLTAQSDPAVVSESADELYEHAPCGYISTLPSGTIVRANQTFLTWTGYPRDVVLGKRLRDLLPLPGRLFYETHYDPLLRMQGFVREMALDLVCASGRLLPVLISSVLHQDAAGQPAVVRTMVFDATERRIYERELLAAQRRAEQLAAVVEASADAIIIISPEGTVQTWNAGAERLFGYSAQEALGRPVRDLIVPSNRSGEFEEALRSMRAGLQVQIETVRQHKSGARMEVSLGLTPHIEPPGELVAISAIIRDVTEQRRLELRLRQAERLQSVATLAGGVAHEVNNQMAVVLGFGEFVLKALGTANPHAPDVQRMITAASKAAGISQGLLAFSRQLPIVRRELQLTAVVQSLLPKLISRVGEGRTLVINSRGTEPRVSVDPAEIEHIVLQLTDNARDAMPSGGRLTITIDEAALSEVDVSAHPGDEVIPGTYVVMAVSDTGQGMDLVTLRRAFEPFFTTKPFGEGSGLGLAMVHGIVKQHGGHVWATSEAGRGTTIRVYLPAMETLPAVPPPSNAPAPA